MYGYLYKITNLVNGKVYIGQTTRTVRYRFKSHGWPCHAHKSILTRAILKYGFENFTVETLGEYNTKDELDLAEIQAIEQYNCRIPNGYNLMEGGKSYGRHSEATKIKLRLQRIGRSSNNSEGRRGYMLGRKLPTYHRQAISESLKGKAKSEEHKEHLRQSALGRKHSPESIEKMREAKRGKPHHYQRVDLTVKDRDEILAMLSQGISYQKIANHFGLKSTKVVRKIKEGVHWLCRE